MLESISVNIEAGVSLRKGANVLRVKNMDIFSAQTRVIFFDELPIGDCLRRSEALISLTF